MPEPTGAYDEVGLDVALALHPSDQEFHAAAGDGLVTTDDDLTIGCPTCGTPGLCATRSALLHAEPMLSAEALRDAAGFLARVRGEEDEYEPEYIRGYDEAVEVLLRLAARHEARSIANCEEGAS
jgi:hypothetical protein